jgi:hypothetical protein
MDVDAVIKALRTFDTREREYRAAMEASDARRDDFSRAGGSRIPMPLLAASDAREGLRAAKGELAEVLLAVMRELMAGEP